MKAFQYNDGGRKDAGYKGFTGDCVCRAICIASGLPYQKVYRRLADGNWKQSPMAGYRNSNKRTVRDVLMFNSLGIKNIWYRSALNTLFFLQTKDFTLTICQQQADWLLKSKGIPTLSLMELSMIMITAIIQSPDWLKVTGN